MVPNPAEVEGEHVVLEQIPEVEGVEHRSRAVVAEERVVHRKVSGMWVEVWEAFYQWGALVSLECPGPILSKAWKTVWNLLAKKVLGLVVLVQLQVALEVLLMVVLAQHSLWSRDPKDMESSCQHLCLRHQSFEV